MASSWLNGLLYALSAVIASNESATAIILACNEISSPLTLLSTKYLKNEGFEPKNPHKQGNYFQKRKSSDLTFKNNFNKVLTFEFICAILNLCI